MTALPDHARVPGVVIDHSPASSGRYIGSPSLATLPNGDYLASHDFFGAGLDQDETRIHRSKDKGKTWETLADLRGQFFSSLFIHNGMLWLMGTSKEYGDAVIRRSADGGATWTVPRDALSGLLLDDAEYHCAPVPVAVHAGRIWRAMEDRNPPEGWGRTFRAFVMSAPVDADLLDARSWRSSNRLRYDQSWPGNAWLEGNILITPDGRVVNFLRNDTERGGKAAIVDVSQDGASVSFDPETGFVDFPGGCKKFTIRYDPRTSLYWSLTNWIHPDDEGGNPERTRNTLALVASKDLRDWTV